ncbi:hypothetical protein BSKO_12145 [Bryopsis sp. KO-2023]|nr:hypothetical protein BSKO_12145 [Bryopsis sp. KO-2023]
MEVQPIYCAEQIVVPENLTDILKAYTKEVIRHQPRDLLEFSAIYFANLATLAQGLTNVEPPTRDQLQVVYTSLRPGEPIFLSDLIKLCKQAGIAKTTLDKVAQLGEFETEGPIQPKQFLVLLLTTTGKNLPAVLNGLFEVFGEGGKLETDEFLMLFGYVASLDSEITPAIFEELTKSLDTTSFLTFASLGGNPVLKEKLTVI